ncbi:hypothetical protein EVG20_g692 [Dentipellis fragilis]|uniref:Uncharacterized protein n=1 Tax=Dentipellis fragilis TaxID=205917 RepID=A0A4Y9ZDU4_9AGAM|nr:hypothetical protein EVG20_g692 [Dentipellis fragilis]
MSSHEEEHNGIVDAAQRPHSFDLTLELERQLDNESLPNSPRGARPQSLDPHVLASIVTNLRLSLAEATKERDDLKTALDASQAKERGLSDELHRMTEKQATMNEELDAARRKSKDDEESITMLRSKVEESRRGLMRLQTQSRRVSQASNMSIDLSRASVSFGPPSSKRASFTPLTGSGASRMSAHRRISSVSDSNVAWSDPMQGDQSLPPASPTSQTITLPDVSTSPPPAHSRRFSGLFGRVPVPEDAEAPAKAHSVEIEALRQEVKILKDALEEARHELTESTEAREASETCVSALRAFIAENNVGLSSAGKSTVPATRVDDGERKGSISSGSGGTGRWGFKLWRAEGSGSAGSATEMGISSASTRASSTTAPPGEPLSKKLGGLFGGRGSGPSTATPPRLQPPVQEPMYNGSDVSSLADSVEPVSPVSEQPSIGVVVQDGSASSSPELGRSAEGMKTEDQPRDAGQGRMGLE